ncbi:DUF2147 domain-containing protein [Roseobacter sp. HKCCA0434]|uniref:DUF2147 domain-containing protein n=1 Tax=Roseobacter sp. HKCCA0434 TaxID=3079297 RepID=UPI002905AEA2|nr:DUF2147 domain-containing protein [Roseobacter sp. HKCCA0434]
MKFALIAALALAPLSAVAQDVTGNWRSQPGETGAYVTVQMGPCSNDANQRCGQITGVFEGDGSPGNQEIVGRPIIWGMQPAGAGSWDNGTIWAPDQDKTYSSKMDLSGNNLSVSGCVLFICRSQTWTRI